jgi:hypothetical protein
VPVARNALWIAAAFSLTASPRLDRELELLKALPRTDTPPKSAQSFGGSIKDDDLVPRDPRHPVPKVLGEFMATATADPEAFDHDGLHTKRITWADVLRYGGKVSDLVMVYTLASVL